MNNSNTFPSFNYCFLDVTVKIELGIQYPAEMFVLQFNNKFRPIEKAWVENFTFFGGKR